MVTTSTNTSRRHARRTIMLGLFLSVAMPGLGLVATRYTLRGILWFIVISVCDVFQDYHFLLNPSVIRICAFYSYILLTSVFWFGMLSDTWIHAKKAKAEVRWYFVVIGIVYACLYISIARLRHASPIEYAVIEGTGSMSPALNGDTHVLLKDRVIWRKDSYFAHLPERGEIVCATAPLFDGSSASACYVKRVAGLPSDSIMLVPWQTTLAHTICLPVPTNNNADIHYFTNHGVVVQLGSNDFFLTGDNRQASYDSRYYGPVNQTNILGKVTAIVWPPWRICVF